MMNPTIHNPTIHDVSRYLLAALFGLPLAVGALIAIPLLTSVSHHLPQTKSIMIVDYIEIPKKRAEIVKKPPAPKPKPPEKPVLKRPVIKPIKKRVAPVPLKRPVRVARKIVPKPAEQPTVKTSLPKRPIKRVPEPEKIQTPALPQVSAALPVPTPIFKLSSMPRFIHREEPVFPEKMKKLGRSAIVGLKALIDKDGKVRQVVVERSAGPEFDEAAVAALQKSSFVPAMQEGKPVAVMLRLPVRFRLL